MKQNLLITTAFAVMLSTVSAAELRIATVDLNGLQLRGSRGALAIVQAGGVRAPLRGAAPFW